MFVSIAPSVFEKSIGGLTLPACTADRVDMMVMMVLMQVLVLVATLLMLVLVVVPLVLLLMLLMKVFPALALLMCCPAYFFQILNAEPVPAGIGSTGGSEGSWSYCSPT